MVQYTVKQHVLLYKLYVNCDYVRKYHRKFHCKHSVATIPSASTVMSTGSILAKKHCVQST
jgi:hypothetical protein